MNRDEIKKLIQGPAATVPTPFDAEYKVDYGRMHDLSQFWVANGLVKGRAVIKVAAAMGEGPMLRASEWPALLKTVVNATEGKATVVAGLHYMDTLRTIDDAKKAQDMGAVALQVCPPIFSAPSQQDLYDYFADISSAIDIGIIVYHTWWYPGGYISTDTFLRLAEIDNVVAIKWSTPEDGDYEDMVKFADTFSVLDNTASPVRCHKLGGRGFVQTTAWANPAHDLKVWDLMENGRYDEADAMYSTVGVPFHEFYLKLDATTGGGQARAVKGLMKIMGLPAGVSRPPSKPLSEEETAELRAMVDSWGWPVPKKPLF